MVGFTVALTALMFAGFFALVLADMGAWWAVAVAAVCALGAVALLAGKE